LRESALALRAAKPADRRKLKTRFLGDIYNVLSVTLGVPPRADERMTWEYLDKDGKFSSWSGTPREFYAQYGKRKGMNPAQSFSLIHDPRNKVETLYTVARLGNVWGGKPVRCECFILARLSAR
jgi:bleomycin hydrolase